MQTFLPFADYTRCAASLDRQRLGKQRLEVIQILNALCNRTRAYANHPITDAWRGYHLSLCVYGLDVCDEWINRGYRDNCRPIIDSFLRSYGLCFSTTHPPWLGHEPLHAMYRGLLVHKNPEHYRDELGWTDDPITQTDWSLFEKVDNPWITITV